MIKPKLALTAGDPAGIGYEIACRFLLSDEAKNYDITLVGHTFIVEKTFSEMFHSLPPSGLKTLEPENNCKFDFNYGEHSVQCGRASMDYIRKAVEETIKGTFDAIVTCPINKKSIKDAGFNFQGHTEYLAHLSEVSNVSMLLAGNHVKTILATTHYSINNVTAALTEDKIITAIKNAHNAGKYFGVAKPKIAVCALNPHGGDCGAIGTEELTLIIPTIKKAVSLGYDAHGPFPADTIFTKAAQWDFIIAMYHDQGMIAVKMDSFGEAVNVTLNLPFIRTSVDHGTAFDVAGKGVASFSSLVKAINLADKMVKYDKSFRRI